MEPRISDLLDLLNLLHNTGNSLSDTVFRSIWSTAFYSSALLWMCLWCSGHSCDYKFMWSCICVCVCVCVLRGKALSEEPEQEVRHRPHTAAAWREWVW